MAIIHTKDDIWLDVADGVDPNGPEVREAVAAERAGRRQRHMESPEFKAKVDKQREEDRATYDPTKGMSALDKVRANVGAGVDATWQGFKQLMPGMKGATDEEVQDKRSRDQHLADSTDLGIGADWMPTAGKALQFAGETLPTLAIPAGALTGFGAKAVTKALPRASAAARMLMGGPIRAGATAGAASGALMPTTSDESRLLNTGLGAAAGAALPLGVAVYKGVRGAVTKAGQREAAGKMLGITHDTPLPADPAALTIRGAEEVPLSTAATYGDQNLASHELTSRASGRSNEGWADLDRRQRQEVWKNVDSATQRAGTETERRAERRAGWDERAQRATDNIKPRVWGRELNQLRSNIDTAIRSPQGQGAMKPILWEIARQIDELGPEGFTPAHLAELRSRMSGSVKGSPTDPFTSAPMTDRYFISLRDEFDRILNASTGNRWDQVLKGYGRESVPVGQAKAETMVKSQFMTPEGVPRVNAPGGVPDVTLAGMRRAVTTPQMKNVRGSAPTFAPDTERTLKGTLEALERSNITNYAKKTSTGGGGSMTEPLAQAAAKLDPTQASNIVAQGWRFARNFGQQKALQELDQALMDPQRYYQLLQDTIKAGRPLSSGQEFVRQALSATAGAALPRAMQAQQPQ